MQTRKVLFLIGILLVTFSILYYFSHPRIEEADYGWCSETSRVGLAYNAGIIAGGRAQSTLDKKLAYQEGFEDGLNCTPVKDGDHGYLRAIKKND